MEKFSSATPQERVQYLDQRWEQLKQTRQSYLDKWRAVAKYISPFSGRFDKDHDTGTRDLNLIKDSEATVDLNILVSGLMSGASSPVRPWFNLQPSDPSLMEDHDVMVWCSQVQQLLLKIFARSNTYNTLHQLYKELALFGVAADIVYDNYDTVIEHHLLSAGEYCLATDHLGIVNTLYREFEMTTAQAVEVFGYDKLSRTIQRAYDDGELSNTYWTFRHAIEPRKDRNAKDMSNKNMPFASYYWEVNTDAKGILRESGFHEFPAITPRWEVLGNDPYGSSPCIVVLPDVMQLQAETKRKAQLVDMMARPAMQAPASARHHPVSLKPGALNFTPSTSPEQQIRAITSNIGDLNAITADIENLHERIKDGLFVRQFLMLEQSAGGSDRKTTAEVYALKEEKMLVLGSVVERNNHETLDKLVTLTLHRLAREGQLPPPPDALGNSTGIDIDYQSLLAQSQKSVDINNVDRMVNAVAAVSQLVPEVLDRIDPDGYVDTYAKRLGVDPEFLCSKETADEKRQERAQAQQQAAQSEQATNAAASINQLAQAQKSGAEASLAGQQLDPVSEEMPI